MKRIYMGEDGHLLVDDDMEKDKIKCKKCNDTGWVRGFGYAINPRGEECYDPCSCEAGRIIRKQRWDAVKDSCIYWEKYRRGEV